MKTWLRISAAFALAAIAAIILSPLYLKPRRGISATLIGIDLEPMPHRVIRFDSGQEFVTNDFGKFDIPRALAEEGESDEFVLTSRRRHTGGNPGLTFIFSPKADYRVSVEPSDLPNKKDARVCLSLVRFWKDHVFQIPIKKKTVVLHGLPGGVDPRQIRATIAGDETLEVKSITREAEEKLIRLTIKMRKVRIRGVHEARVH